MREQFVGDRFGPRIFANCLEALPYLLKRRRYDADFLAPSSRLSAELIRFLEGVSKRHDWRLPSRLRPVPHATVKFLKMEATLTDLEDLLGIDEEGDDDD
jgi:hypothetical protein